MKEAFLLPLASRPYDANKRVAITNEVNVIATRLIPIKTFKDFYNEATSEAVGAFDTELATANRAFEGVDQYFSRKGLHRSCTATDGWSGNGGALGRQWVQPVVRFDARLRDGTRD
jgi:hypothetical protein